ncbi:hypothetical protein AV530_015694 [Patagioenas fasciata monilis]|uniref:Uncharacterized protein n=1 Tax=Patagioenas fasciata monilis TaxID=372326 RepID=A0A1V4KIN8_PATFA|nr:hypothetical protein AV530_015694 [Patagioenas fasciata monilis]
MQVRSISFQQKPEEVTPVEMKSPTQCSSPCFSAAGVSSLSFTIHALIFLKGHRHEEKTLLNIPALQDSSPGLI